MTQGEDQSFSAIYPKNEWYASWFNSPYYHLLYQNRDETEARDFIEKLLDHLQLKQGSRVLDLACGKGRHSVCLFEHGLEVTGADLSSENIIHCKTFEKNRLSFVQHDMRSVLAVGLFDAVFNLFTSFGYFKTDHENEKVVKAASVSLRKGGLFILDFLNVSKALLTLNEVTDTCVGKIRFITSKELKDDQIIKHIEVLEGDLRLHFTEEVKTLRQSDFERYFNAAGLEVEAIFGNYALDPFVESSSPRLIFITRKK